MKSDLNKASEKVFTALSHPNRLRILISLRGRVCCNGKLSEELGIEHSNLSRHLKQLVDCGILISWKEGVHTCYRITDERVFTLMETAASLSSNKIFSDVHHP